MNKVILSPKSMIESVIMEISIEFLENNNGETLEKWLKKYLKDNYNDKFRIDVGPTEETTYSKFSNNQYDAYSFNLLDRKNHSYNEHSFVSVDYKNFHFNYSVPSKEANS